MTTLYLIDRYGNYAGEREHVKYAKLPRRFTQVPPPDVPFPVWRGWQWYSAGAPITPPPVDPDAEAEEKADKLMASDELKALASATIDLVMAAANNPNFGNLTKAQVTALFRQRIISNLKD